MSNQKPTLNNLRPNSGTKHAGKRVGRGLGSGTGVTAGRGYKGQKSRSGGSVRIGYEGGQMPIQRRLPKVGFRSRRAVDTDEIRLHELALVKADVIDKKALLEAGLINANIKRVKVIKSGELNKAVTTKGLLVTAGARQAIEAAGGKIEV